MSVLRHETARSWAAKKREGITAAFVIALLFSAFGMYASTGVFGENLHEVAPDEFYRSAQLTRAELDALVARHGIRCVVSLRKCDPPAAEMVAEARHLDEVGLVRQNIPMSPTRLPTPEAIAALVERFDRGPYPMLVHCEEGADRTGLATVVWQVLHGGRSLGEARASDLSLRTGHFAWGQAHAMDDFFDLYTRTASGSSLREWMLEIYPTLYDGRARPQPAGDAFAHAPD
jgi:protein tyrosine phosphatase (PTP) superfamily phosphohydrolase (DUF442 family)